MEFLTNTTFSKISEEPKNDTFCYKKLSLIAPDLSNVDLSSFEKMPKTVYATPTDEQLKERELLIKKNNGNFSIEHFEVPNDIMRLFLKTLPIELLYFIGDVGLQVLKGDKQVVPHIDRGRKVVINYYYDVSDETTIFYDKINDQHGIVHNGSNIYLEEELTVIEEFIAKPNDVYLLDVSCIHNVTNMKPNVSRRFITLPIKHLKFNDVCSILQKYNLCT